MGHPDLLYSLRIDFLCFFGVDAEGFHFAVEMAALEAEDFRGAADIAMGVFQLAQDVVAFVGFACLLQRWKFLSMAAGAAGNQDGQMLAFNA